MCHTHTSIYLLLPSRNVKHEQGDERETRRDERESEIQRKSSLRQATATLLLQLLLHRRSVCERPAARGKNSCFQWLAGVGFLKKPNIWLGWKEFRECVCRSIYRSVHPSVRLFCLSVCPSIGLTVRPSVLSEYQCVCRSVCSRLSIHSRSK